MNLARRLEALEKGVGSEPILLKMPDGSTVTLRGVGDYTLNDYQLKLVGWAATDVISIRWVDHLFGYNMDLARE
jgi:hypothetical protein